jgi:SAM-dependent methyltransferase
MLFLTHANLAKVYDLFRYKEMGFKLEKFPGYTDDQWGIKAHNRPWIEEMGQFAEGQKIVEVGGAYSLLPKYLAEKYDLEAWIGDDFGMSANEPLWSRWGDPRELPEQYPSTKYIFKRFGTFSPKFPDAYFDRIFSVSTLEHIPEGERVNVFKDMHRCLKPGGLQVHTIDIPSQSPRETLFAGLGDKFPFLHRIDRRTYSAIRMWIDLIKSSGVNLKVKQPNSLNLLSKDVLFESPDVVYRFVPPNDAPKPYKPSASLLIVIENKE